MACIKERLEAIARETEILSRRIDQVRGEIESPSTRRYWCDADAQRLIALYPATPMHQLEAALQRTDRQIYSKAKALGLKRSAEYLASPASGRMRPGSQLGGSTRFQPGQKSWNSGLKGWKAGGRSAETRFKKGCMSGRARELHKPIGYERVTKDGILQRKIREDGPPQSRWQSVHSILWETHNGPVPPGHVVVFSDRGPRHADITIDRLELISRAELARRNTIHRYPPELKAAIKKVARAKRKLQEKLKNENPD